MKTISTATKCSDFWRSWIHRVQLGALAVTKLRRKHSHLRQSLARRECATTSKAAKRKQVNQRRLQVTIGDVRDAALVEQRGDGPRPRSITLPRRWRLPHRCMIRKLDFEINLGGTFNILEAARKAGNQPFLLFTSTNKVYGELGMHPLVGESHATASSTFAE